MIKRNQRLTGKEIQKFRSVSQKATPTAVFRTSIFFVKASHNALGRNRFAVIVGNSVSKKATKRHSIKRTFVDCVQKWPQCGMDIIISALPRCANASSGAIRSELRNTGVALQRAM